MKSKNELTIATMSDTWYGDFKTQEEARKKQTITTRAYIRNEIKKFNKSYPYCKARVHVKSTSSAPYLVEFTVFIDSIYWGYKCYRSRVEPTHINYIMRQIKNKVLELDEDTIKILKLGL